MDDGITASQVNELANFVQGLDELTSTTGIAVAWDGPISLTVRDNGGDHSGMFDLTSEVDGDDVVRYRLLPQR